MLMGEHAEHEIVSLLYVLVVFVILTALVSCFAVDVFLLDELK